MTRRNFILGGCAGLGCAVLALRSQPADGDEPVRAVGRVFDAATGAPLSGVGVSNGWSFVSTDASGRYELPEIKPAYPFVFVTCPAGYRPELAYYHSMKAGAMGPAQVDFPLRPDPVRRLADLRLVHVSDSHIGIRSKLHFASEDDLVADYRAAIADAAPGLLINTGDVTDRGREADFLACLAANTAAGVPVVTVFGNHDSDADRADFDNDTTKTNNARFQATLGPDQYSFEWGPYHFIVSGIYWPGTAFRRPRMEAWLRSDLARTPPDRRIILLTHDKPLVYPGITDNYAPPLGELARHPGAFLALHGHHHTTHFFRHGGITVIGVPPCCVGAIDTSARGYAVVDLAGGHLRSFEFRQFARPAAAGRENANVASASGVALRLPTSETRPIWTHSTGTSLHRAAPALVGDEVILSLGDNRPRELTGVLALDRSTGERRWFYPTESTVKNTVGWSAVSGTDLAASVFVAEVSGRIHRVARGTGQRLWAVDLPYFPDRYLYAVPLVTPDAIHLAQHKGSYALDPTDGRMKWTTGVHWDDNRSSVYQRPAMDDAALYYLQTSFLGAYAVIAQSRADGSILWKRRLDRPGPEYPRRMFQSHFPSPLLVGDSLVVGGLADRLAVFDRITGETRWHLPALHHEGPLVSPIAAEDHFGYYTLSEHASGVIHHEGTLFVSMANGALCAVELTSGRRLWRFAAENESLLDFQPYHRGRGNILTEAACWRDYLWVGGTDGKLRLIEAKTGACVATTDFASPITAPPVVHGDDLLIGTYDGRLHAYRLPA